MRDVRIFADLESGEIHVTWVSPCGTTYRARWARLATAEAVLIRDVLERESAVARTLDELVERAPVRPLAVHARGGPLCRACRSAFCPPTDEPGCDPAG